MRSLSTTILAAFLVLTIGSSICSATMIQVKGSDTLINLVQRLSEEFMEQNRNAMIAVTGGGSGTGIAALINKKCDIANASRVMKDKEMKMAKDNGVNVKRVIIARDGLSVIVHGNNPVEKLTINQLGRIFRGKVTNWNEVGGRDQKISLYGRQSSSGTFVFFRELVLKGEYSQKMRRMNGNSQIVEAVKNDKTGIGYVGVGYVKNVKGITVLMVAENPDSDYTSPLNSEDVKTGKYPISRPLNQYLNGEPKGAVKRFIKFELSEKGPKIVEQEGFFPPTEEAWKINKANVHIW